MATNISVDRLKSALTDGGARANFFEVVIPFINGDDNILIKAAALPASVVSPITVPFQGKQLQLAGDRTFEPWTVTIINDNNFRIRNAMEEWMNRIISHEQGVAQDDSPQSYMEDATVHQLNRKGEVVQTYEFKSIWPSNVSTIDLSYDSENTLSEFTVEFQVTYWKNSNSSIT